MSYSMQSVGAYTGYDELDNPLTQKIIEKNGAIDSASLEEYGQIAGSMGATAACAAFGVTAPMAAGCGILGGILGGMIAKAVPVAKGADLTVAIIDTWNNYSRPYALSAQKGILAVRAYLTMRDTFITDAVHASPQMTRSLADAFLTKNGCPPAPVHPRWTPNAVRAQTGAEFEAFVIPASPSKYYTDQLGHGGYISPLYEARQAQKILGIDPKWYLLLTYGGAAPIASMGDAIDWGLVGWDELGHNAFGATGTCRLPWATTLGMSNWGQAAPVRACPTSKPTELAAQLIKKLEAVRASVNLKPWLQGGIMQLKVAEAPSMGVVGKATITLGALGLGWWLAKHFL